MTAKAVVTVAIEVHNTPAAHIAQRYMSDANNPSRGITALAELLEAVSTGHVMGKVLAFVDEADGTAASSTLTFDQSNMDNGDTFTVAGVVFTRQTSPSSEASDGEYAGSTDDDTAASEAETAIEAHPALKGLVSVSRASAVLTVTCQVKGLIGNAVTLATSDATAVAVGAAKLASGATGTTEKGARAYRAGA